MAVVIETSGWLAFGTTETDSASLTVDADADVILIFGALWESTGLTTNPTITLGGNSPDVIKHYGPQDGNLDDGFVAAWYSGGNLPASGSRTVAIDWNTFSTPINEGPRVFAIQLSGAQTSDPGAGYWDGDSVDGSPSVSVTSATSDFVVCFAERFGGIPALPSGFTSLGTENTADMGARVFYDTGNSPTTSASTTSGSYALAIMVSVPEAAGGTTITGTGALSAQASSLAATGTITKTGTGALTAQASAVAGTGTAGPVHTGTGALTAQASAVAGTGTITRTGTGALTAQAASVAGSGYIIDSSIYTYIHLVNPITTAGSLLEGYIGDPPVTGDILVAEKVTTPDGKTVTLNADGTFELSSAPNANQTIARYVIQADGTIGAESDYTIEAGATGALTAQDSSISGTGSVGGSVTGTGALSAQDSSLAGTGTITRTGTGALSAQASQVSGSGTVGNASTGTGALAAQDSAASGSGTITRVGTGSLAAQDSALAGSGTVLGSITGTGALAADASQISGTGTRTVTGTGALAAQSASIYGATTPQNFETLSFSLKLDRDITASLPIQRLVA